MARAYQNPDFSDLSSEPQADEWHALRGELVALLDQVEGRYVRVERQEPELSGLTRRVRDLRDQVVGPEPLALRREALSKVKRAVDRFSDREAIVEHDEATDALTSAIAEIRGRQMNIGLPPVGRRPTEFPELRELNALVGGLSGRLGALEGELKTQRANNGNVQEVASQVEQLTHVVELIAGAVGETGQVKRLEAQIGALAAIIEGGPRVDLSTINLRLDDVSATVGKLVELQAEQLEREIERENAKKPAPAEKIAPAMKAIETSVRNVYDRIDSIEKSLAISSGDFERLTSEMADFTRAVKDTSVGPEKLVSRVEALISDVAHLDGSNNDVAALKDDIASLHNAVMASMEPRFLRLESRIDALSDKVAAPQDNTEVESQLRLLMTRMDETGKQLNALTKMYADQPDAADLEAMATLVAERTGEAITRKTPAPVAMFGADSLKSIEDRLASLIKSAGKTPDYDELASLVAERTSQAVVKSIPATPSTGISDEGMTALEKRMTAIFNTAGKDTAERLARLEATLTARKQAALAVLDVEDDVESPKVAKAASTPAKPAPAAPAKAAETTKLDQMLSAMSEAEDRMPINPDDDLPLVDQSFKAENHLHAALSASRPSVSEELSPRPASDRPSFDPASIKRPPRPQSSLAETRETFAPPPVQAKPVEPMAPEPLVSQSSTSTFVAAARRAQRARQEANPVAASASNSLISRALSRVKTQTQSQSQSGAAELPKVEPVAEVADTLVPTAKPKGLARFKKPNAETIEPLAPAFGPGAEGDEEPAEKANFLGQHRRPLLLAAALVAVSMLALNLVLQRTTAPVSPPVEASVSPEAPAMSEPPAAIQPEAPASNPMVPAVSENVSLVKPEPRVIDMVDSMATGSISPVSQGFSDNLDAAALSNTLKTAKPPSDIASTEAFELPPETLGPLALREAAAKGDARAQFEVAAIYAEGRAVPQDYAEAAKWYERAAAQAFVPAQYRLGNLYEAGQGVEQDYAVAKLWYQRAAEAGNRMGMHNLAALHAGGQLGDQQFEQAVEWFTRAAERGMIDSQFNLGMLYARGLGVAQDFEQSYLWFALAARSGDADAAKARDDIAKSLTAESVTRLNGELSVWKAQPLEISANFAPLGTWSESFEVGETIVAKDVVSKVQSALMRIGYDVGTPDGVAGPRTAEAIKAFERSTGMTESGAINPRLLAVLGSQPV